MASSRRSASSQAMARSGLSSAPSNPRDGRAARQRRRGQDGEERVALMLACVRASGLKLTPQRMAIVRALAGDPTHPTAQEIYERLRGALPTMSFATVYNTLDALASEGLCAALALSPGAARFDPNMAAHHHAVCDRCGLVRDVPCEPLAEGRAGCATAVALGASAPMPLSSVPGFEVRSVERIYRGLCATCVREGARPKAVQPRGTPASLARRARRA